MSKILNPHTGRPARPATVHLFNPKKDITAAEVAEVLMAFMASTDIAFASLELLNEPVHRHFMEVSADGTPVQPAH